MWAVSTSSQSFDRIVEWAIDMIGGNFNDARDLESAEAFLTREPTASRCQRLRSPAVTSHPPWDISNDLESRTTEVYRKLRSAEAVNNCFPSSP